MQQKESKWAVLACVLCFAFAGLGVLLFFCLGIGITLADSRPPIEVSDLVTYSIVLGMYACLPCAAACVIATFVCAKAPRAGKTMAVVLLTLCVLLLCVFLGAMLEFQSKAGASLSLLLTLLQGRAIPELPV